MSLDDKKQPHKFQGSVLYLQPEGLVDQTGNMVMPRDEILAALSAARSAIGEHEALSALKLAVHQELGDRPSDEFPKITAAMMAHDLIVIRAPRSHELPPLKTTARDLVAKPSATRQAIEALQEIKDVAERLATTTQQEADKKTGPTPYLEGQVKAFKQIAMSIESRLRAKEAIHRAERKAKP